MPNHVMTRVYIDGGYVSQVEFMKAIRGNKLCIDFNTLIPLEEETWGECVTKWGTKWNAYDQEVIKGGFCFCTAWCEPMPIYEELFRKAESFGINLTIYWANEDLGSGTGRAYREKGEVEIVLGRGYEEDWKNYLEAWGDEYDPLGKDD